MKACASAGSTIRISSTSPGKSSLSTRFPHERSELSHWRKRLGDKLELLLAHSLRVAHVSGALRTRDLVRVTVDTTVQPKNITFPTDAKLLHAAINGLFFFFFFFKFFLRQSYIRIAKRAAMMAGRYAHAKQFNRHLAAAHPAHPSGSVDIGRKIAGRENVEAAFEPPLSRASQVRSQQQRQRGWKLYSFRAPETKCIGKGKAARPRVRGQASMSPPTPAPRAASSCCTTGRCRASLRRHTCGTSSRAS